MPITNTILSNHNAFFYYSNKAGNKNAFNTVVAIAYIFGIPGLSSNTILSIFIYLYYTQVLPYAEKNHAGDHSTHQQRLFYHVQPREIKL